jgi:GDPmannose 4,6-dehydratase
MFNHESPFRPHRFVTRKIVATACRIHRGSMEKLNLGNLQIRRDWGWAPEYVDAMWRMLQQEKAQDFVIATGETHSLEEFTKKVFSYLSLNWRDHVVIDPELFRPADLFNGNADPSKAEKVLGWKATFRLDDIVRGMVDAELK